MDNLFSKLVNKVYTVNIAIVHYLFHTLHIISQDQRSKSLEIYNEVQEMRNNCKFKNDDKNKQVDKLIEGATIKGDKKQSTILPDGPIFNILGMLGVKALTLPKVSKDPFKIFVLNKESYAVTAKDTTLDAVTVGENYTIAEDILT